MSNIKETFEKKILSALLKYDREARFIHAFKNPKVELPEFGETQENNQKTLEALARKAIAKSLKLNQVNEEIYPQQNPDLRKLQTLRELQINSKNPNDLKIEGLSLNIFSELKKRRLSKAFGELHPLDKDKIIQENWDFKTIENFINNKVKNILEKYNSKNFIYEKMNFLIKNLNEIYEKLNEKQKEILSNLPDQNLLALANFDNKDLLQAIKNLNSKDKNLFSEFLKLDVRKLNALSKINLTSITFNLNEENLRNFFNSPTEKVEALCKIKNLNELIDHGLIGDQDNLNKYFLKLIKIKPEILTELVKSEHAYYIILRLREKELIHILNSLTANQMRELAKTKKLDDIIHYLSKDNVIQLFNFDEEKLKALNKIYALKILEDLQEQGLVSEFLNLDKEKLKVLANIKDLIYLIHNLYSTKNIKMFFELSLEKIEALAKIDDLYFVIYKLNREDLIPKLFELSLETLQNRNSIKEALGLDFDIKMKKEAQVKTNLDLVEKININEENKLCCNIL